MKFKPQKREAQREDRIWFRIAYGATSLEKQAEAWHTHLSSHVTFPFHALCRYGSKEPPVLAGAHLQVIGMTSLREWIDRATVRIIAGNKGVPIFLDLLEPVSCDPATTQAIWDWLYWVRRGYFAPERQPIHLSGLTVRHP